MKVILYARVSSEQQAQQDLSISAQLKSLRKYALDQGWEIVHEFVDSAESARTANRPAFQQMISLAKSAKRTFETILVWKLSRFARNREDSIIYKSLLRKHGVAVVSINEQIDESPAGQLLEGLIEVIDEFYSANLSSDTVRGLRENISRGFRNGGTMPIGYRAESILDGSNHRTKIVPDPVFAPIIQRIFQMYLSGLGFKGIVNILNSEGVRTNKSKRWSTSHISFILKSETYIGHVVWDKRKKGRYWRGNGSTEEGRRFENVHEPIIEKSVFQRVQSILAERHMSRAHPRRVSSKYMLSGLVICGQCGVPLTGAAAKSSKYFYYACMNRRKRGNEACHAKLIRKEKLEKFVVDRLQDSILTPTNIKELISITNKKILATYQHSKENVSVIDKALEDAREKLDRLFNALELGKLGLDVLSPRILEQKKAIATLEAQKASLIASADEFLIHVDGPTMQGYINDLKALLLSGSFTQQKTFLKSFIKKVRVQGKEVLIEYTVPPLQAVGGQPLAEVLPMERNGVPQPNIQRTFEARFPYP